MVIVDAFQISKPHLLRISAGLLTNLRSLKCTRLLLYQKDINPITVKTKKAIPLKPEQLYKKNSHASYYWPKYSLILSL
jgi:hypothetical protein